MYCYAITHTNTFFSNFKQNNAYEKEQNLPLCIGFYAGVGGCKSTTNEQQPCINEILPCQECEASNCEKFIDKELIYDGFYYFGSGYHWLTDPTDENRRGIRVCDSTLLKKIKLISGKVYKVDYSTKKSCYVIGKNSPSPGVQTIFIDILKISEK